MVRFTLRNIMERTSVKMDLGDEDPLSEINCTASEYWGGEYILRSGYTLLRSDGKVGDYIREGDVIEALPDPDRISEVETWGRDSERMRTL